MALYTFLNDIVARIGLDIAVLLAITGLLTGMLAAWRRLRRPAHPLVNLSVWLPCLLAVVLVVLGIAECWRMISLLVQQEAINETQTQLMVRSAIWGSGRCLAVGAAATFWLRLWLRRSGAFEKHVEQ